MMSWLADLELVPMGSDVVPVLEVGGVQRVPAARVRWPATRPLPSDELRELDPDAWVPVVHRGVLEPGVDQWPPTSIRAVTTWFFREQPEPGSMAADVIRRDVARERKTWTSVAVPDGMRYVRVEVDFVLENPINCGKPTPRDPYPVHATYLIRLVRDRRLRRWATALRQQMVWRRLAPRSWLRKPDESGLVVNGMEVPAATGPRAWLPVTARRTLTLQPGARAGHHVRAVTARWYEIRPAVYAPLPKPDITMLHDVSSDRPADETLIRIRVPRGMRYVDLGVSFSSGPAEPIHYLVRLKKLGSVHFGCSWAWHRRSAAGRGV